MQFSPVLLFAGLVAAVPCTSTNPAHNGTAPDPSTYENVDITNFSVRETYGNTSAVSDIESVSFTLNGNVTCTGNEPGLSGDVFPCGETFYSFGLINGTTTQFGLRVYKQTSPFAGWYGTGDVPTYCRAGGNSIELCQQVAETTIVISAATA